MTHKIAVVPGDGIGEEVVPEGVCVVVDNRAQILLKETVRAGEDSCDCGI